MLYIIAYDTKMILKFYFFQFFNNFFPVRLEQMRICVHSHFYIIMPQTFRNHKRVRTKVDQQTGVRVPLRYNNDKQKKPLFSRGLSVCRLLFNSFSKLKIDENYKEKRRLFY